MQYELSIYCETPKQAEELLEASRTLGYGATFYIPIEPGFLPVVHVYGQKKHLNKLFAIVGGLNGVKEIRFYKGRSLTAEKTFKY